MMYLMNPSFNPDIIGKELVPVFFKDEKHHLFEWDSFLTEDITLIAYLEKNAKLVDIYKSSQITSNGFFLSARFRSLLESMLLSTHKFYEVSLNDSNGSRHEYFYLQFQSNKQIRLDYDLKESVFYTLKVIGKTVEEDNLAFSSHDDLQRKFKRHAAQPLIQFRAKQIGFTGYKNYDLVPHGISRGQFFISERLAQEISKMGLEGMDIKRTDLIK